MAVQISIITPVLNRASFIQGALDSVAVQRDRDMEHIVVDGGSTDGTMEIVSRARDIAWVSEPDQGLYDAINKGIALARGDLIGLLNSDDRYEPWALRAARSTLGNNPTAEIVAGGAGIYHHATMDGPPLALIEDLGTKMLRSACIITGVPIINARFFHRRLLDRVGRFDQRFPVAADRDFLIRCVATRPQTAAIPELVYRYTFHPGSLSIYSFKRSLQNGRDLAAARARLREGHGGELGALYRAWHAWCVGYQMGALLREQSPGAAIDVGLSGFREAPLWATRFVPLLVDHWARSRARRLAGSSDRSRRTPG